MHSRTLQPLVSLESKQPLLSYVEKLRHCPGVSYDLAMDLLLAHLSLEAYSHQDKTTVYSLLLRDSIHEAARFIGIPNKKFYQRIGRLTRNSTFRMACRHTCSCAVSFIRSISARVSTISFAPRCASICAVLTESFPAVHFLARALTGSLAYSLKEVADDLLAASGQGRAPDSMPLLVSTEIPPQYRAGTVAGASDTATQVTGQKKRRPMTHVGDHYRMLPAPRGQAAGNGHPVGQ